MSVYESWVPVPVPGFIVTPVVGASAFNTGRDLWHVECCVCGVVVSEATTSPPSAAARHQREMRDAMLAYEQERRQ